MDFEDSPREAAFRAEVRAWLDANLPRKREQEERISAISGFRDDPEMLASARHWQRRLAEGGWAGITWPVVHGGRGAGVVEAIVFAEELARYDVPAWIFTIGINMVGPTLIAHGSEEQKARYLGPMLRGDEIWCQLWSEPDAGSDLAGLTSTATRDGDDFVLNGQKVWTSGAHYSDFGLGVFRTNLDVPKHEGISCFVVPMRTPGITVRPLRQITGDAHFNEVFFDDVRVSAANLVGELDEGWRVARTTMMNERLSAGALASAAESASALVRLACSARRNGQAAAADPVVRQELSRVYTLARVFDLTTARVRAALARDAIPGPEVSVLKLLAALLETEVTRLGCALLGPAGVLWGNAAPEGGRWGKALVGSFAIHIGGGTDEIQRNIIGETVLGLPREPSVDRGVPFRELQVGTRR